MYQIDFLSALVGLLSGVAGFSVLMIRDTMRPFGRTRSH